MKTIHRTPPGKNNPVWQCNAYTDKGQVRDINQDAILDLSNQQLWIVADGMGGHAQGDYASQIVCQTLMHFKTSAFNGISKERLIRGLTQCNSHLIEKARHEGLGVVGCTVAALLIRKQSILCSWSGDSRIYRLRNCRLTLMTRDHCEQSTIEDLDRIRFPDAPLWGSSMLSGAIGSTAKLMVEHCWYALKPNDSFLLCTDGLTKEVSDKEIQHTLINANSNEVIDKLSSLYQQRGARDNIGMLWVHSNTTDETLNAGD